MLIYLSSSKPETDKEMKLDETCRSSDRVWIRIRTGGYYVAFPDGCGGVQYKDMSQALEEETTGFCAPSEVYDEDSAGNLHIKDQPVNEHADSGSADQENASVTVQKRRRGRPPGSKNKPKNPDDEPVFLNGLSGGIEPQEKPVQLSAKRKRGRPPGSKNKPKKPENMPI